MPNISAPTNVSSSVTSNLADLDALPLKPVKLERQPHATTDQFEQAASHAKAPKISMSHLSAANPLHRSMDPSIVDSLFGSPLYSYMKKFDVVKALAQLAPVIDSGEFDINAPMMGHHYSRYVGYPPLAAAAREANAEIVEVLLAQKRINVCARDNRQQDLIPLRTVLMHAVRGAIDHERLDALKVLLADKRVAASLNDKSKSGNGKLEYTALDFALDGMQNNKTAEPNLSIAKLLMQSGAKAHFYQSFVEKNADIFTAAT